MKEKFENYSLIKKTNVLMMVFLMLPILMFGIILMAWVYKTNTSHLYGEYDEGLERAASRLESAYSEVEILPMECMQNEPLQRIAADRIVGKDYVNVREWIDDIYEKNEWIGTICISLNNGKQFQVGEYIAENTQHVYERLNGKEVVWTEENVEYLLKKQGREEKNLVTFYAQIHSYYTDEKEPIGTISVRIPKKKLQELYEKELEPEYTSVCLIREDGTILASTEENGERDRKTYFVEVLEKIGQKEKGICWKKDKVLFFRKSTVYGWYLIEEIPMTVLYNNVISVLILMFCALAVCFLFCIIFSKIQRRYLISPIYSLAEAFSKTGEASFIPIPDIKRNDEIGMLQRAFNQMNDRLDMLINQVYSVNLEKQEAELRALTERINPHFLYNTLDSIHWKAIRNRDQDVAEQILALSDVYRYLLNKGNEFLRISDEVKFQEKYMYLMKMRFGNRIVWKSEIAEDVLDIAIPKLIIQPLIENAIVHGIEPAPEGGEIFLRIQKKENDLLIEVRDTGIGFGDSIFLHNDKIDRLEEAFALKNINSRLKLHYKDGYDYDILSCEGKGTKVRIRLCLQKSEKKGDCDK